MALTCREMPFSSNSCRRQQQGTPAEERYYVNATEVEQLNSIPSRHRVMEWHQRQYKRTPLNCKKRTKEVNQIVISDQWGEKTRIISPRNRFLTVVFQSVSASQYPHSFQQQENGEYEEK